MAEQGAESASATVEAPILLRQYVPLDAYKPRLYINDMPKAGLHMLEQMVGVLLSPSAVGTNGSPWLGTYKWHSFSMEWQNLRQYLWRMSCLEKGQYLMGHSAYHEDIERLMGYANIGHIFLYRDFRDVAVSQAHHIWDEKQPSWQHEHKDFYRMLGGFDDVLLAVIEGLGPYPGIIERWEEYAAWLEVEGVLALTYEQMRTEIERTAGRIILYLMRRATQLIEGNHFGIEMAPEDIKKVSGQMAAATEKPSGTFRKGLVGGWREEFTPEHVEAFKESDPNGWLVKLGFETTPDWSLEASC